MKAYYYIAATKSVRKMLRDFPEIKEMLEAGEKRKIIADLAKHLEEKDKKGLCLIEEFCKHCIYHQYLGDGYVRCTARDITLTKHNKGDCKQYKEGYTGYTNV